VFGTLTFVTKVFNPRIALICCTPSSPDVLMTTGSSSDVHLRPCSFLFFNLPEFETGASKNITGLKKNVDDYNKKAGNVKTTKFKTDTTSASKNVTGLKSNVSAWNLVDLVLPVFFLS